MHQLTEQDLLTIIARRDRRYDGRFYFGVKTTKIYCRPVCPAKPKAENIVIFKSTTEAENNGFRPCYRCRPDWGPGRKSYDAPMGTVSQALRLIQDHPGEELDIAALARFLGVSDRHVRRLFKEQLGASPIEVMITKRLHFANQLLRESGASITDVAYASGFRSLRRFNEAFKKRYDQAPSTVRKSKETAPGLVHILALKIAIREPYDWQNVLAYLYGHAAYGCEFVENHRYHRFIPRNDFISENNLFCSISVGYQTGQGFLDVELSNVPLKEVRLVLGRVKALFDTEHDPFDLPLTSAGQARSVRVPGAFDPFATAVAIILGQLVSIQCAKTMLRNLIERFGQPLGDHQGRAVFAFPTPATLAVAPVASIGLTQSKGAAIRELARAVASGAISFGAEASFAQTQAALLAIKGIGPWTVAMIGMRCQGDPDAFPAADLIVRRALELKLVEPADWVAARAYMTHVLWQEHGTALSKTKAKKGELL